MKNCLRCLLLILILLSACAPLRPDPGIRLSSTTNTAGSTAVPAPTGTPTITCTPTITSTPEPSGCLRPPDDYTRVEVNGWVLNARTVAMLAHAAELYGGPIDITGSAITQGSYHDNGSASFGTHLGGGAVDISVIKKPEWTVYYAEIESLIAALRAAGFAAWLRVYGEVYEDSPIHIHAIAIGDAELSGEAREQLDGPNGYFRGYTGIPWEQRPDRHGGPVVCQWMVDLGYGDWSQ